MDAFCQTNTESLCIIQYLQKLQQQRKQHPNGIYIFHNNR